MFVTSRLYPGLGIYQIIISLEQGKKKDLNSKHRFRGMGLYNYKFNFKTFPNNLTIGCSEMDGRFVNQNNSAVF